MPFTVAAVGLRTYADSSWLNIMELNTAITDRAVIGFTNQPRLQVYSGTGLYGSYFRGCWAVHYWRLGANKNLLDVRGAHHLPFFFIKKHSMLDIFSPFEILWNIFFWCATFFSLLKIDIFPRVTLSSCNNFPLDYPLLTFLCFMWTLLLLNYSFYTLLFTVCLVGASRVDE